MPPPAASSPPQSRASLPTELEPGAEETLDGLLGGRVRLIQPRQGYRAAVDPVLLAAAVPARPGEAVLELGAGTGAAFLCLMARVADLAVTAVEIDAEAAGRARRNAALNAVADRVQVVAADAFAGLPMLRGRHFAQVMMNPPYLEAGAADASPDPAKARATVEGRGGAGAWINLAARLAAPGGRLTLIHRADRLVALLAGLADSRFGAIEILPLWPRPGEAARRVVLRAVAGSRAPTTLSPGLMLHGPEGGFTGAAEAILRDGAVLG